LAAALLGAGAALAASIAPDAADELKGPVPAHVVDVVDGDTIRVDVHIWLDQKVETLVRLSGIDAPELHGRCTEEKRLAEEARDFLAARIAGAEVSLADLEYGKFAGRIVARVIAGDGEDLGASLIRAGLARPYDGGKRLPWCEGATARSD
jgi:endonuclease YncB( thermonuclease family)